MAKKAPAKKAPVKKQRPQADSSDDDANEEEKKPHIQIHQQQQQLVPRPQQPIAARNNIPLDPYAFSPDDEADANKKYQFSVMCMMGKDINIPLQLDIEKDAAITALKKKISDRTGGKLALNDMILTLGANVCKRSMTVRQAGIKNNVQIILT